MTYVLDYAQCKAKFDEEVVQVNLYNFLAIFIKLNDSEFEKINFSYFIFANSLNSRSAVSNMHVALSIVSWCCFEWPVRHVFQLIKVDIVFLTLAAMFLYLRWRWQLFVSVAVTWYQIDFEDGVRLWIDPKAQLTLLGSEMDYVEDRLSSEFVFRNPNIKSTCGCGESFSI